MLKEYFNLFELSPSFKRVFLFLSYQLFTIVIYLVNLSFVAFIHFLLKHKMALIEEWVYDSQWQLLIAAKLISFLIILKFISIRFSQRSPIKYYIKNYKLNIGMEIPIIIVFFWVFFLFLGKPVINDYSEKFVVANFVSIIGCVSYFLIDIVIFHLLAELYNISKKVSIVEILFFSSTFVLVNKTVFLQQVDLTGYIFFNFLFGLIIAIVPKFSWNRPFVFFLLFSAPFAIFLGLDPVWGQDYSLFKFSTPINQLELIVLFIVAMLYYFYKNQRIIYEKE
jgi:hypothetical protein